MKKLFLSLMMCTVSIALFADSTFAYDGVYYDTFSESLTARVATQSDYWNPSGDVVIHDEIEDPSGVSYTVTIIFSMAFYGSNIESISIPGTITSMGQFCIANCKKLKTVTFADELTIIGQCAFTDDTALETIDLSNTVVTNISTQAFDGCTGLTSIVLPSTLTTLAYNSLRNCTSLSSLTCLATTPPSLTTTSTPFANVPVSTCTLYVPYGCKEAYATATCWKDFDNIVELENDNTPLADGDTFEHDGIIYKVISADDQTVEVTYYGESYSDDDAIAYYTGDITIPASFEYMDATYTVIGVGDYAFYKSGVSSISFTTPSNVTYIGDRAMYNCTTITELTLPEGVLTVGDQSLRECTSMTTLNLPETVTYLGEYLCWGNTALTAINIPSSVTTLGKYVFNNCSTATELTLSPNITEWGSHAFYNCASLTSVEIPEGITEVGEYAFGNCDELVFVTIPDAVTTLGAHTFAACPKLESCVLPESMTEVDGYLFYNCPSLTEVTIGSKVESFGASVFAGCPALVAIYSLNPTPPSAPSSTFADTTVKTGTTDKETCVLYIPVGSYDDYSTADEWKDFFNIVEMTEFAIETLEATDITDTSATLHGVVTAAYNDPITEKGFEYWTGEEEAKKAVVEGDEMSATIEGLEPGTTYTCRAYATTVVGTTYGEDIQFSTLGGAGSFTPDVDPASGSDVDELYNNITFYNPTEGGAIYVNDYCEEVIEVYSEDETLVTQQTQFYTEFGPDGEDYSQTVFFEDRVSDEGTYYVKVPAELFIVYDEEGKTCYNEAMTLTYTITADSGDQEPNYELVFYPEDGSTLDILSTISISCEDGITRVLMPNEEITIVDSEGNNYGYSVLEVADDTGFVTEVDIILATEIVDAGTYYVNVPVGYFDIGQSTNNAFTLTYTITGTLTGIGGVSLNSENVDGIYSTSGQKLNTMVKGVNIVRMSDGSTKKVLIK